MIGKLREAANAARLRAGQMWREHKERGQEKATEPPGVTIPASLVRSAHLASWMAYFALVYFLWLYTLDIARDRAAALHITHAGAWIGELQFYFPYIIGFAIVAIGIPYVAKIAIPTFMSLRWRGNFWPKLWALFIAAAVSLVVIAGTFTVQGDTLLERDREGAVAVAQVDQANATLAGQITAKEAELRSMMENSNAYLAQAASVGAVEWQRSYIDQTAANDPQRDRIVRALGAARAADTIRSELSALRARAASATTREAVSARVSDTSNGWIADTLGWLEGARAILLSLVMDIVCLIMPWIALRLEQARNAQMGLYTDAIRSRWDLIEDRSTADKPGYMTPEQVQEATAPMDANYKGDVIYDEKGNELRYVAGHVRRKDSKWIPGHYRPTGRRQKQEIEVEVGGQKFTTSGIEEEIGVEHDGGGRVGSVAAVAGIERIDVVDEAGDSGQADPGTGNDNPPGPSDDGVNGVQSELFQNDSPSEALPEPELTEAERAEFAMLAADADADVDLTASVQISAGDEVIVSAPQDAEIADASDEDDDKNNEQNNEPIDQTDPPAEREPETDERRLIAATVAAE